MGTHLLFCSSLLLILRDGRLGFCSDLHLTSSWVQVTPLNRNLQEVSKKSCSCYNSSAHISSGRAPPLIQQLHQSPDTYTAAQHQDRSIFLFAAHSKLSVMFSLPDAFPGSLLRREDPVWRLLRLGPEELLLGSSHKLSLGSSLQFPSGNGRLNVLKTSFLLEGTGTDFFF